MAIWTVYLVAAGICFVTAVGLFQTLMRAYSFDMALVLGLVPTAATFLAAIMLLEGTRQRRRWAFWPALVVLVAIVPSNIVSLIDYSLNPNLPAAGFASEQDVASRGASPLRALLKPTEAGFWGNRMKTILATLVVLLIVALPTPILWRLRSKGVLR
ncbi:hypothetical protein [uncultured Litoreibacter sp.]|uniref:hypothetical protein n=1 Tax=uncultured Litoreibacter sp. TaxID=1392394 RepID=UPI0026117518|nr:hypothetical protein [uncultured Litoreibacter sp.]